MSYQRSSLKPSTSDPEIAAKYSCDRELAFMLKETNEKDHFLEIIILPSVQRTQAQWGHQPKILYKERIWLFQYTYKLWICLEPDNIK